MDLHKLAMPRTTATGYQFYRKISANKPRKWQDWNKKPPPLLPPLRVQKTIKMESATGEKENGDRRNLRDLKQLAVAI